MDLKKKISQLTAGTPADTDAIPYVDLTTNTTKRAPKSALKGDTGPQGPQGIQGIQGPQGPQGPTGANGTRVSNVTSSKVGKTTTVTLNGDFDNAPYQFNVQDGLDGTGSGDAMKNETQAISTGINTPISLSQGTGNTFSITDGSGFINFNGAITQVSWTGKTNIVDTYPSNDTTYIFINNVGAVIQQATIIPQDYKDKILIGAIGKTSGIIVFFRPFGLDNYNANNLSDLLSIIGTIQNGDIKLLGRPDLGLNITSGTIFSPGSNSASTTYGPNYTPIPAVSNKPFKMVKQDGLGSFEIGNEITSLPVSLYDNNGVLSAVGTNKFTNMYVYLSSTGFMYIQYGQFLYGSLDEAKSARANELYNKWNYGKQIVLLGVISIKGNATATNSTSTTYLANFGKFGTGVGGGGGSITDHNNLTNIQGGTAGDYQHLTTAQVTALLNAVPNTRTLTINGITYDLSADRSWTITAGASFNGINGQSFSFPGEIIPGKIAELTAFNSGTFAEMQISTLTRTTGTTTVTVKKNGTTIGTATITSATTATNGRYYGTSTDLADSFVANDIITISVTDDGSPYGTGLICNLK